MKFLKLDKKKGAGTPEIKGKFAYLVAIGDIATFPTIDEKGVRLLGNITFKPDCGMIPIYLSSTSQEFSYDVMGDDDEKNYKVKFMGTHPGTELEALEFAKNQIEQPFLVLIPGCNLEEPWKLLGEITNPLIFTSTHKASRENSKFTFTFEQRIGSEFIYFSYGGVVIAPEVPGPNVPLNGFWAKVDASNIDDHIAAWRTKLGIGSIDIDYTQHGPITTTSNSVTIDLSPLGENFAVIDGVKYTEPTTIPETPKPFTAVSPGKLKSVIIYVLPDAEVFHLAEGVEGDEAIDPDYNGLLVKRIIVSDSAQIVEGDLDAFQLKANEAWVNLALNDVGTTVQTISIHHAALRFNIISGASNIKIGGFRFYATRFLYDGIVITLRNDTSGPLEITTIAGIGIISIDADGLPITLQQFESIDLAYHLVDGVFYALKSGGEVFDPTSLQNQIDALDDDLDIEYTQRVAAIANLQTQLNTANLEIAELKVGQITITTSTSITTNTLSSINSRSQLGRNVVINNGINAINITCELSSDVNFLASYIKEGSANVTFVAGAGTTLELYDDTAVMVGKSTASVSRVGNKFKIQISSR